MNLLSGKEKEKLEYQHTLELRKVLIDRLFLGVLLLLFTFGINILIENHRNELIKKNFIIQKKYDAMLILRESFDELHATYSYWTLNNYKYLPNDHNNQFDKLLSELERKTNSINVLFSDQFNKNLEHFYWIYIGLRAQGIEKSAKYNLFMSDIREAFEAICRKEVGIDNNLNNHVFSVIPMAKEEVFKQGSYRMFQVNYFAWKNWKKDLSVKPHTNENP